MALLKNDSNTTVTKVEVEDADSEEIRAQHDCSQRSQCSGSGPQVARTSGLSDSRVLPKCLIKASSGANPTSLKKVIVDRHSLNWKDECRERNKGNGQSEQAIGHHPVRKIVVPLKENSVKLWRTPSGKLVKLDARPYMDTPRHSLGGNVPSQPKFVRLANGKLAKISTKRVLTSRTSSFSSNFGSGQVKVDIGKVCAPSATAKVIASSDPIDISALMGNGPSISHSIPHLDDSSSSKSIKTEPMESEEISGEHELQQSGHPNGHQQPRKTSIAVALSGITTGPHVGDLVKLVDQPLFSDEIRANFFGKSCGICRTTIPAMKKNLLSLEGRLGALVDTVQNLLIYLNPIDRKTLESITTPSSFPLSNENVKGIAVATPPPSCATTATASYRIIDPTNGSEKPPSYLLPVAIKADTLLESGISEIPSKGSHQFSNNPKDLRSGLSSSSTSLKKESISTPRYIPVIRGRRFIVADRAKALRTVYSSSAASKTPKNEEVESSEQRAQFTIKLGEDMKPANCYASNGDD